MRQLWRRIKFRWQCWRIGVCPEHGEPIQYINDSRWCPTCWKQWRDCCDLAERQKRDRKLELGRRIKEGYRG